ncbi:hypothetical protein [Cytobacillus sp. IB215316]|uniref:hypothetical protein n=1 Tax=Cytobacillus sp. IB215316 TaxID=3097354 RepID=UPI002A160E5D|nr:hypothetical protein [Cytobacillus sp. IB215316]MDX8360759.1 hypothetical protein [Cytobacillus sp. IB215316]
MNLYYRISFVLMVAVVIVVSLMISNSGEVDTLPTFKSKVVLDEAFIGLDHFIIFTSGEIIYIENVNGNYIEEIQKVNGSIEEAIDILPMESVEKIKFSYLTNTDMIDPTTLNIGITSSIPYTYQSDIENSSTYVSTLVNDGWELIAKYRNHTYVDLYFRKNNILARVIILKDKMKIFYNIDGQLPDPWTYISGRLNSLR